MLGEYITAIHNQVRGGPTVIESELINVAGNGAPAGRKAGTDRVTSLAAHKA